MPGIFGVYAFGEGRKNWNATRFIYYGLSALQGRGQEAASYASLNDADRALHVERVDGFVEELFEREEDIIRGFLAVGQVSPIEGDYLVSIESPVRMVLAGDGKPALDGEKRSAFQKFAQRLSDGIGELKDPLEAASRLVRETPGGYSFLALTEDQEMICGRDPMGVKPLEVGAIGFDLGIVASETAGLDMVGANHSGCIAPGEVAVFDPMRITRKPLKTRSCAYCAFEYVYLARPDSYLNAVPVHEVRDRIGARLAEESPVDGDVVIGVPETAMPFAMAYAQRARVPVRIGFVRTGRGVRSAIRPDQLERLMGVQLKLNPITAAVEGKDVVLIDDSVVRGNTLKSTVLNLKRRGARRVHVRIGSPPIKSHCPFGTEIPPQDELIGRALPHQEIAEIIGADSFAYLSIEGLIKATGLKREDLCLGCFTAEYPGEEP